MTIRLGIFSDSHLGNNELDPIRGEDSFNSFHEALEIFYENNVDAVLHSGDMFDIPTPSRSTLIKSIKCLQEFVFKEPNGEKDEISIEEYPSTGSALTNPPNIYDKNVLVKLPVFAIHGNHDPPAGFGSFSVCDLLAENKLINYFQKIHDQNDILLNPVIIKKKNTWVCIYGFQNILEVQFEIALQKNLIHFTKPIVDDENIFVYNILLLHQDRQSYSRDSMRLQTTEYLSKIFRENKINYSKTPMITVMGVY